ncbi:MAG: D-glycerate dehydrogenase [Caldithrix sp.]|nr:D-glycerate dehydrogenase [Caldithrix sp.]
MHSKKIFITSQIPRAGIDVLTGKGYDVEVHTQQPILTSAQLKKKLESVDGVIPLLSDTIDRAVIDAARNLKVIANYAAGYNNIDVAYAKEKGITVTNTPDILTDATADLTWALLLAVAKRIPEADTFTRHGNFTGWHPLLMLGKEVTGKTLGIVGAGRIGRAVAKRAAAFCMSLVYYSRRRSTDFEQQTGARFVALRELFSQSDYISFHCPLTEETHHILHAQNMNLLKPDAVVINTARGAVIEEQALYRALKAGKIGGAGLDVYEFEPQITEGLKELNNVVLLPHIGSATLQTRQAMAKLAAQNIIRVLEGNPPITAV